MTNEQLVEAIIKEVKRVLVSRGIEVGGSSGAVPAPQGARAPSNERPTPATTDAPKSSGRPPAVARPAVSVGTTDLTGRQVITQKDLASLSNTTITVMKRAVISPLALDFAKERKITIARVEQAAANPGMQSGKPGTVTAAIVVSPEFPADKNVVSSYLATKGFTVRDLSGNGYEKAVTDLARAVASGSAAFGVCIEKTGLEGPIHANRNDRIRAVHCRTVLEARAARVDFGANVIVVGAGSDPQTVVAAFCGLE